MINKYIYFILNIKSIIGQTYLVYLLFFNNECMKIHISSKFDLKTTKIFFQYDYYTIISLLLCITYRSYRFCACYIYFNKICIVYIRNILTYKIKS